jgi:hypothetical protein
VRRLGGNDADCALLAYANRHPDEGQLWVIEPQAIEEPGLVCQALDDPGPVALQDAPDHPLSGLVADGPQRFDLVLVQGADQQVAGLPVDEGHHALAHPSPLVQHLQHLMQGRAEIQRTAEHRAHLEQGGELGLQQLLAGLGAGAGAGVIGVGHQGGTSGVILPPRRRSA